MKATFPILSVAAIAGLLLTAATGLSRDANDRLVVHEWGTFTVLLDAKGDPIQGVNVNEESLPDFVYRLASDLAPESSQLAPALGGERYSTFQPVPPGGPGRSKGLARAYRLAIMRMETPIIYFYPPGGREMTVDVSVKFRRGWLSEWYPEAANKSPGYPGALGSGDPGSLTWENLRIGAETDIPATDEHVWLAPRRVNSARVKTANKGQGEQYLFYRGVAQLQSPIRVVTPPGKTILELHGNLESEITGEHVVEHLWLADIRPDGKVAYRALDPVVLSSDNKGRLATTANAFPEEAYAAANMPRLRKSMHRAITSAGLYRDEATAMLNTWELSYFKSSGMRLFYVLPEAWTDHQLPLEISKPAEVKRIMIGRVELVTSEQEQALAAIAAGPVSKPDWLKSGLGELPEKERAALFNDIKTGAKSLARLDHLDVPADYRAYLRLGRFRDAIVLNRAHHDKNIRQFAWNYQITLR